ncbi:MAG TPA: hypothetical protein VEW71_02795 [Allosphingosinicella sp.]|nr:hypothetical protein [Allosphingosinicella sp.]
MSGKGDSRGRQRLIDAAAKEAFLAGLRRGEHREDAAFAAGFSLMGFYGARARDPAFRAGWTEALAASAAAERRVRAYAARGERAERGEVRIASANRRIYQCRWHRNVRFTAERRAIFLASFAATCDTKASAEAAGVSESTVTYHIRNDRAFAEGFREALAEGYAHLEAEALRQRLAAQAKLRAAIEAAGGALPPALAACPECGQRPDEGAEFDRIMKLLARWDRKPRRPDSRFTPGGRRQRWTFEEAIVLLDKKLRALGVRRPDPPADVEN